MVDATMMKTISPNRRGVRLLLLGVLVAFAGALTVSAWAQAPGRMGQGGPGMDTAWACNTAWGTAR